MSISVEKEWITGDEERFGKEIQEMFAGYMRRSVGEMIDRSNELLVVLDKKTKVEQVVPGEIFVNLREYVVAKLVFYMKLAETVDTQEAEALDDAVWLYFSLLTNFKDDQAMRLVEFCEDQGEAELWQKMAAALKKYYEEVAGESYESAFVY